MHKEPCQYVSGQPWAYHGPLQGQLHSLQCEAGVLEPALYAVAGLVRWFEEEAAVLLMSAGVLQLALLSNHSEQSPASV